MVYKSTESTMRKNFTTGRQKYRGTKRAETRVLENSKNVKREGEVESVVAFRTDFWGSESELWQYLLIM